MSKQIWDLYLASSPMANVSIQIAENASPIKDIFGVMNNDLELKAYVAGSTIEIEDGQYADALKKAFGERIMPIAIQEKVVSQGKRISGTQVRELVTKLKASVVKLETIADPNSIEYSKAKNEYLNTYETLKGCFPEAVIQKGGYNDILNILDIPILTPDQLQENIFSINWWGASLNELSDEKPDVIKDFINFAVEALELKNTPEVEFSDDEDLSKNMHSLGMYNPSTDKLLVIKGSRMIADILRTLAHELVHRKQDELKPLSAEDGKTGSDIENEANAAAGILLRQFGAYRPEIFEKLTEAEEDQKKNYKIYCDMDGVIVDFVDGYKKLTGKDITGQHMKGDKAFWDPITKAGVKFWVTLKWMPDGKQLWNYIKKYNPDLLSAPSYEESSKIGKHLWVKRNTPGTKLILRSAERKQEFATPDSILIDDRTDNIERWRNAGGVGILHITADDTIKELQKLGL